MAFGSVRERSATETGTGTLAAWGAFLADACALAGSDSADSLDYAPQGGLVEDGRCEASALSPGDRDETIYEAGQTGMAKSSAKVEETSDDQGGGSVRRWVVIGLVGAAYLPLVGRHLFSLAQRPEHQFILLVLIAAALLLRARWPAKVGVPIRAGVALGLERIFLAVGLVGLAASVFFRSPPLAAASAIFAFGSLLIYLSGRRLTGHLLLAWLLLWFLVPLPLGRDERVAQWMARKTAGLSSAALDELSVYHVRESDTLATLQSKVVVSGIYRGVNSPFFLLACAAVYVIVLRRSMVIACLFLASAPLLIVVANSTAVMALATSPLGASLQSVPVESSVFLVASSLFVLLTFFCYDQLLLFLLFPVRSRSNFLSRQWNRVVLLGVEEQYVEVPVYGAEYGGYGGYGEYDDEEETGPPPPPPPQAVDAWAVWESWIVGGLAACLLGVQIAMIFVRGGV